MQELSDCSRVERSPANMPAAPGDMLMLTGIAVGAGIMLTYLALFGFAGRRLKSVERISDREPQEVIVLPPRTHR